MNFENYLSQSAQKIDEELDLILSDFLKETKKTDIKLLPLVLGFLNSCKGGKRIRGVLVKMGYEMTRSVIPAKAEIYTNKTWIPGQARDDNKEIIKVAVAYEILHASILVHDDIIDQSGLRRGKPSLYKVLGGNHYGESQALSLGDMGFFMAMRIITESGFLQEEKVQALTWLNKIMVDTTIGEMLDLEKADPLTVMKLKTAKYTTSGPLILGAILGGGDNKLLQALGEFGDSLGIAYQIQDDLLDEEFKAGAAEDCQRKVLEYSAEARKIIPEISKNGQTRKLLEEMVEYLMKRQK